MSNLKLLCKILRLKDMKITQFWFKNRNKELHLAVKPYKNGCRWPHCGRRCPIVRQATEFRHWEDLTLMGLKVLLGYSPKEILFPTHGRVQEEIPWAPAYSRLTHRLEWRFCSMCPIITTWAPPAHLGLLAARTPPAPRLLPSTLSPGAAGLLLGPDPDTDGRRRKPGASFLHPVHPAQPDHHAGAP